jgi:hypothetical protein
MDRLFFHKFVIPNRAEGAAWILPFCGTSKTAGSSPPLRAGSE